MSSCKSDEMKRAEIKLIRICQEEVFKREILCLTRKDNVPPDSQLKFLYAFLDIEFQLLLACSEPTEL